MLNQSKEKIEKKLYKIISTTKNNISFVGQKVCVCLVGGYTKTLFVRA